MSPEDLARLLDQIPTVHDENVLVGEGTVDDAGIYRLTDDTCLVQTLDIFPPVIQDPYLYGQIVAANALSDVYAMGGKPVTALNLVGFPTGQLPLEILAEILRGGADKVKEAGCVLIGGHTWRDAEIKYGLSLTGVVHPERIVSNANAKPSDRLILTKPIGTGVITTAIRGGGVPPELERRISLGMARLNKSASEKMLAHGVTAATDITGFGLFGHAAEIANASDVTLRFRMEDIALFPGAVQFSREGFLPGGSKKNKTYLEAQVALDPSIPEEVTDLLFDAQTSGGMLICAPKGEAEALLKEIREGGDPEAMEVGEVLPREDVSIRLVE
ncbi:MAG: selenide, water dikinase SelD [Planctomycetota bacterium]|jgi:selenide,water dikinase